MLISLMGRQTQNPRGLLCCRLACLCFLVGGSLGLLHYFQNIDWIHRHHYAFFIYALALESIGVGMFIVLLILGVFQQEFGSRKKASTL